MTDTSKSLDALQEAYEGALIALDDSGLAAILYQRCTIDVCEACAAYASIPPMVETFRLALDALRSERAFLSAALASGVHLDGHERQRAIHHGLMANEPEGN